MPFSAAHALVPGYELLEYRIDALLASGSFGLTYLAHDMQMNARVAIREYLPIGIAARGRDSMIEPLFPREGDLLRQAVVRFLEESRLFAAVRHPNVMRVSRLFEVNGTAYMVTDYETGTTLYDWRARAGCPSQNALSRILLPVLDGLQAMHEAGVLHRDLKPTRIRLRADGTPVILDFGAAHHVPTGRLRDATLQVTLGYAPLEVYYSGGKRGPWSDIYSLAGIAYWMISGERPQEAPERMLGDTMPKLASLPDAGQYTPDFLAALDWALELDADNRPREAKTFRRALAPGGMDVADVVRTMTSREPRAAPTAQPAPSKPEPGEFVPDPELLASAQHELARRLGPIANVVVKNALNDASDWREFCDRAAAHIGDESARQSFLELFSGRDRPLPDPGLGSPAPAVVEPEPVASFDAELLAGLEAELATYLGAIAKIVIKRCASQARNKGELYEMIGVELEDPVRTRKFVAWAEARYGLR
jgi:serine/threonine protein kinase